MHAQATHQGEDPETHRCRIDVGRQRDKEKRQGTRRRESHPAQGEEQSHDWKEGERLGEAKNPGPPPTSTNSNNYPPWSHTPGARYKAVQARARWCGIRAVQRTFFKPKPMTRQFIGTPGNDGRFGAKDLRPGWLARSQPESLQRARGATSGVHVDHQRDVFRHVVKPARASSRGQPCWFGSQCKYPFCPFGHPNQAADCWFGLDCRYPYCPFRHPEGVEGPAQAVWGGRGRPQTRVGSAWEPHRGQKAAPRMGGEWKGGSQKGKGKGGQRKGREGKGKGRMDPWVCGGGSMYPVYGEPATHGAHWERERPSGVRAHRTGPVHVCNHTPATPSTILKGRGKGKGTRKGKGKGKGGTDGGFAARTQRQQGQRRSSAPGQGKRCPSAMKGGVGAPTHSAGPPGVGSDFFG